MRIDTVFLRRCIQALDGKAIIVCMSRRILRKHGYPPDKQEKATRTVLEQAEALSAGWAA